VLDREGRVLARGLHPGVLSERGLGPALEALAERAPLDVEVAAASGSGIVGLRDRAEALGGSLALESPVDEGTTVRAYLPVERA
jgi:glucose-6-phosphate-specific signal transduction histidine kinase